jgi:hypothetical protein
MSGASALASARRRRAGAAQPDPQNSSSRNATNNATNRTSIIDQQDSDQKLTPLQILQMHSTKISDLEQSIDQKINAGIESFLNAHVKTLPEPELEHIQSDEWDRINAKLAALEKSHAENLLETKELYKMKLSEEVIIANLNNKIEQSIATKINSLNDTIKSILMNIEKLSGLTKINEMYTTRIDNLIEELNTLKLLVIKNQTLSLESNSDIQKIKEEIKQVEVSIAEHNNILTSLNDQDDHDEDDANNIFNNSDATHMLIKSMFGQTMENPDFKKLNIHDALDDTSTTDGSCDHADLHDDICELSGESNNEQTTLDDVKQEVCEEIDVLSAKLIEKFEETTESGIEVVNATSEENEEANEENEENEEAMGEN